jgi:hypothetical protein
MQQAWQRAVVLCARQRGKLEQRQWDLCAARIEPSELLLSCVS